MCHCVSSPHLESKYDLELFFKIIHPPENLRLGLQPFVFKF